MESTSDLLSSEGASPRVVVYTTETIIAVAYVVAEEHIQMKIENPTIQTTVMCLLATYFAWDTAYPPAYINTLQFLESEIIRHVPKLKPTVEKFIRNIH